MADAFVRIYRAANGLEAHMIKGMLEQHGMQVRVFGIGLSSGVGELPADVIEVDIEVPAGYRQYARELIDEYERAVTAGVNGSSWRCRQCSERNPASFDLCWHCGLPPGSRES